MVPEGGFEPPTRGFSVHCSTPELPGHGLRLAMKAVLGCGVLRLCITWCKGNFGTNANYFR